MVPVPKPHFYVTSVPWFQSYASNDVHLSIISSALFIWHTKIRSWSHSPAISIWQLWLGLRTTVLRTHLVPGHLQRNLESDWFQQLEHISPGNWSLFSCKQPTLCGYFLTNMDWFEPANSVCCRAERLLGKNNVSNFKIYFLVKWCYLFIYLMILLYIKHVEYHIILKTIGIKEISHQNIGNRAKRKFQRRSCSECKLCGLFILGLDLGRLTEKLKYCFTRDGLD